MWAGLTDAEALRTGDMEPKPWGSRSLVERLLWAWSVVPPAHMAHGNTIQWPQLSSSEYGSLTL